MLSHFVIDRVAAEDLPLEHKSADLIISALSLIWFADKNPFYDRYLI